MTTSTLSPRWKWHASVWKDIPAESEEPKFSRELDTFEGILYSDGKHLSISGMDTFTFVKVSKLSEDGALEKIQISDRPQMIGHGIIQDGQVFISDLSQNRVLAWRDLDATVAGADPDAILGATSLNDTDPDKTKSGLFWPLRLEFDGERLWVGEYKFSGRFFLSSGMTHPPAEITMRKTEPPTYQTESPPARRKSATLLLTTFLVLMHPK